jgi:hypothetical protein
MHAQRLERMTHNAERLIRHPEVRPDLGVEQIRDILWTYSSPDLYQLLVLQRGWTLAAYGEFLFRGISVSCSALTKPSVDIEASGQATAHPPQEPTDDWLLLPVVLQYQLTSRPQHVPCARQGS